MSGETKLTPIRPEVDGEVVERLEEILAKARAGEVQGFTCVFATRGMTAVARGGRMSLPALFYAFECAKFEELIQARCGPEKDGGGG